MLENTSFIALRLNKMPKLEKILRDYFQETFIKIFSNQNDLEILSVSTGDASWDFCLLNENKNISKIFATDIIEYGISPYDKSKLQKSGMWEFELVEPEKELDYSKNKFDFIYHFDVLEHVNNPYKFLNSQYQVLKEGGYIFIYTPNLFRPLNILRLIFGKLSFPRLLGTDNTYGDCVHIQEFYSGNLKNILLEIGFKNIKVTEILFGFPNFQICKFPKNNITKALSHGIVFVASK